MRAAIRAAVAVALMAGVAMPPSTASAQNKTLNVYNWSDYIGPTVIPGFEKATGAKVNYDTYDNNEILEAKLSAGKSGYDVAYPTYTPFLARGIKAGLYEKLDRSKLPSFKNLDPALLKVMQKYDPGNQYAIPYITAFVAIAVNVEKVRAALPDVDTSSLDLILNPANAKKLQSCGLEIIDSPTEVLAVVLHHLKLDPNSVKPADLKRAGAALDKIRPYIRKFDSSGYINDLANGDACVALGYSTDIAIANRRAKEAGKPYTIAIKVPEGGTLSYIDTIAVPAGAPHYDLAMAWIDYNMQPKVMADTTNFAGGRNGTLASLPYVKPEIANDPGLYPSAAVQDTFFTLSSGSPQYDRLRTRTWTQVKTGH